MNDNPKIKIIFFDVGGVLLFKKHHPIEVIAEHFGINLDRANHAQTEKNNDPELGKAWNAMRTVEDQYTYGLLSARRFLEIAGLSVTDENITFIADCWNKSTHSLMPGAKEIIEYLSPKYRLGIISNAMPSRKGDELTNHGLLGHFDPIVISRELGVEKPHPEIYQAALELAGVDASEAAFVDDWPQALQGAQTAGFGKTFFMDFPRGNWDEDVSGSVKIEGLLDLKKYL